MSGNIQSVLSTQKTLDAASFSAIKTPEQGEQTTIQPKDMQKIFFAQTSAAPAQPVQPEQAKPAVSEMQINEENIITDENVQTVLEQQKKLKRVKIGADLSSLSENDKEVLVILEDVAPYIDQLYMLQMYDKNPEILAVLENSKDPKAKILLERFKLCGGPFDPFTGKSFLRGFGEQPPGVNLYPPGVTKEGFETWIDEHHKNKAEFINPFTVIRRAGDGFVAVPYSKAYADLLEPAAKLLEKAAAKTNNPTLRDYLNAVANAFRTDNYSKTNEKWMNLTGPFSGLVIGPYEVYNDGIFGTKAFFEMIVPITNPKKGEELQKYKQFFSELQDNLPLRKELRDTYTKNPNSLLLVTDIVVNAGNSRFPAAAACNLPNDEKDRANGTKNSLYTNIMDSKYENMIRAAAEILIDPSQLEYLSSSARFDFVLFHEVSHGMGPGTIEVAQKDGTKKRVPVNDMLGTLYAPLEEARADTSSIHSNFYLIKKGESKQKKESLMVMHLLYSILVSKYGTKLAHGLGAVTQFNYMLEKGAFIYNSTTGKYKVDFDKFGEALKSLLNEIDEIQATGDAERAKKLFDKYGKTPEFLQKSFEELKVIPKEILPEYMNDKWMNSSLPIKQ